MPECNSIVIRTREEELVVLLASDMSTVHTIDCRDIEWVAIYGERLTVCLTRTPERIAVDSGGQVWLLGSHWLGDDMTQIWPAVPEKVEVEV